MIPRLIAVDVVVCACVCARVCARGLMALIGGMAGWLDWLVAVLVRRLRAGSIDWRVGRHVQLTHYLSDERVGRTTLRCRPNIAALSQSKLRRRCAHALARASVSAMMPQRIAVGCNSLPLLDHISTLKEHPSLVSTWRCT